MFLLSTLIAISLISKAQVNDPGLLTLERIYASNEFRTQGLPQVRWIDGGEAYTTLERSPAVWGGMDIVRYDTKSGEKEIILTSSLLIPEGETRPLSISNYIWSSDRNYLMIFTNTKRVWRRNTKGDYWFLNLSSGELKKLGGKAPVSSLMFCKFSPDSKKAGYVSEHNIYVENLESGKIVALTNDGSVTTINGTFDWVYEEEFGCRDGFRWSPDSKNIAFWQLDATGIRDFYMINNTDSLYPFIIPVQYPKVGKSNSAARIGVVSVTGGNINWMKIDGDPRNNYLPRMEWAASSEELLIHQLNRLQNTITLLLANKDTGVTKTILIEKDEAWIDVVDDLKWMDDGKSFTWVSEREGWRQVYLVSRDGKNLQPLTPGEYDVINILNINEKSNYLYFIASPDNATQRYLYRVKMDGKGKAERLSPADQSGTHSYNISPDPKWAFHTFSNANTPPVINLITLPNHKVERYLVNNKSYAEKISRLKQLPIEFLRIDIGDGIELDAWMMKPYNFDKNKKYPVVYNLYSEPASTTVNDRWGTGGLYNLMLAQKGYIVISIDNRGTPAPRGREWRKCIYKKVGILSSAEQAKAAMEINKWPFVDKNRIGVYGWSGGGSITLNMLFRHPEIYHTGMSIAPVPLQLLYDNVYQERYMGSPVDDYDTYIEGSPITYAKNLKGNLLLVHGTGDDNVHYQGSELLINELVKHNKYFTMFAYPNRSHGIYEGPGTTMHLRQMLTRYLMENLPPGGN
ncbi:S9 family peptidase [Bacteroidota bacterium]